MANAITMGLLIAGGFCFGVGMCLWLAKAYPTLWARLVLF